MGPLNGVQSALLLMCGNNGLSFFRTPIIVVIS